MSIEVTTDKTDVLTCENYKYTLKYSCAAGTGNCNNVTMTASAPSGMLFPNQNVGLTSDIDSYTFTADRRSVTFTFKEPLIAGNTGIIELTGMGECGKPDGTVATLTGSIQSGVGAPVTDIVNTTLHSYNKFCPQITGTKGLALDNSTLYDTRLDFVGNLYGSVGVGTTSIGSVSMVQSFPANTVINNVSILSYNSIGQVFYPPNTCVASGSGTTTPIISCTFPANAFHVEGIYPPNAQITADVTYPSAFFNAGDDVANDVSVTYTPEGGSQIVATNNHTINYQNGATYAARTPASCISYLNEVRKLETPNSKFNIVKTSTVTDIRPGDTPLYNININNTGNTTLTNLIAEDAIPVGLKVLQITKDAFPIGLAGTEVITYWYKTVANTTYTRITTFPYIVPATDEITDIKIEISSLPPGAIVRYIDVQVALKDDNTATSFVNCFTGTASPSATFDNSKACHTLNLKALDPYSSLQINKWLSTIPNNQYGTTYGVPQNIGTTLWSVFNVLNLSGGQPLQNPMVMDLLPAGLDYDGEIRYGTSSCTLPTANTTEIIPNYNGTGRTLVRLSWAAPMPSPCNSWISIKTKISALAPGGTTSGADWIAQLSNPYSVLTKGIKNSAFFTGSSIAKCNKPNIYEPLSYYSAVDIYDLDGDATTTGDTLCFASAQLNTTSVAQLESVKWVKGACDTVYTKHPNHGLTMPGGLANYKLVVRNNGNVPATSIEILDMLPYIGDIGVKDLTARLTQWRPNLVTPMTTPTGITAYYTTVQNPCRSDYAAGGPAGCNTPNWTTVLPTDPTTVQGLKFDFGTKILNPGDAVELIWDMRAPENPPMTGDSIAWNSFGFKAIRADNNDPFLAAEPNKVGIKLKPLVPGAYGNFVWIDTNKDGKQDPTEVGIDGVRVELRRDNGDGIADPKNDELVSFTATGNGGKYLFPNLPVGNYFAVFFVPNGYASSPANITTPNDSLDSDGVATICSGNRVTVTGITNIAANQLDIRWGQGVYPDKAALGNYVWFDENNNNIQDESTTNGVNGVIVCLYKDNGDGIAEPDAADGAPFARDTTSNDIYGRPGYYLFENLEAGKYFVKFKLTTGQTLTANTGASTTEGDQTDSDPNSLATTPVTELTDGEVDLTWDAGIIIPIGPYNLGNLVWNDVNNNGFVDGTETGINGVSVVLFEDRNNNDKPDADEYVSSTTTATISGIAGTYNFLKLPAGNYIVQIPDANFGNQLKDFVSSTGNDPATDPDNNIENDDNGTAVVACGVISKPITLGADAEPFDAGKTNNSVDFGFYKCTKPNYTATVTQPTCVGTKGNITLGTGTIGDKVAFSTDVALIPTYTNATLISSLPSGVVVANIDNPSSNLTYFLRIYNGEDGCYKDFTFTIIPLICCTPPTLTSVSTDTATCTNGVANSNAAVHVTGIMSMEKYAYGTNGTTGLFAATATTSTATSIAIIGLVNPSVSTTYTVRIYGIDSTCFNDTTVVLPPSVCPPCSVTATFTQNACNNNGSTAISTDDYFTVTVSNVTSTNGGTSGKYEVILNGTVVLNTGGTAYGTPVTVGGISDFKSDGATTYNLTVRDFNIPTCITTVFTTTASATCSTQDCKPIICLPVTITKN